MPPRFALLGLVAGLLLLPASGARAAGGCAGADVSIVSASVPSAKSALRCLVNVERTARGLPAVADDARLDAAAQSYSSDMVTRQYFSHTAPNGKGPGDRATRAGYRWSFIGENIASGQTTPRLVMAAWMASPGHCENILSPLAADLGVGVTPGLTMLGAPSFDAGRGGTWTEILGRRSGATRSRARTAPQAGCPYVQLVKIPR